MCWENQQFKSEPRACCRRHKNSVSRSLLCNFWITMHKNDVWALTAWLGCLRPLIAPSKGTNRRYEYTANARWREIRDANELPPAVALLQHVATREAPQHHTQRNATLRVCLSADGQAGRQTGERRNCSPAAQIALVMFARIKSRPREHTRYVLCACTV